MFQSLLHWFDDRTGLITIANGWCQRPIAGRACGLKAWPAVLLLSFCVQAITGFFLWVYYSPSAQTAWESVYYLQHEVDGGWLLRAVHHYSAQVLVALLIVYFVQLIVTGAYRAPREVTYWTVVGMGLLSLALLLTGDLLGWDRNGYSATQVRTGFLKLLPYIGDGLYRIAIGGAGPAFGHLTLTRFFALHVGVFAVLFGGLVVLHLWLVRRDDEVAARESGKSVPFWPNQAWISAAACLVVMAVVLGLACRHGVSGPHRGVPHGSPADPDPANAYAAARPEWVLVGVYEFSHLFPGEYAIVPIFLVPGLLALLALGAPLVGRLQLGHYINIGLTACVLAAIVVMTGISWSKDARDPQQQQAIADERDLAQRSVELAANGIPPTGALTLLRDDPKTQGPKLFAQFCASCHDHTTTVDGTIVGIAAEKSSAPNLYQYASREWIRGILDAKQVNGPHYFGNTKFRGKDMAGAVKDMWNEAENDKTVDTLKTELDQIAAAVSAEAKLKSQAAADARDTKLIEAGRSGIEDRCIDCHRYHGKPGAGAPELTGYGSREWLSSIIGDPTQARFYGEKNDRMPAFAKDKTLSPQQIDLLTDWLRGEWYEPEEK